MNRWRFTALSVPNESWSVRHELTASTRTPSQSNTTTDGFDALSDMVSPLEPDITGFAQRASAKERRPRRARSPEAFVR